MRRLGIQSGLASFYLAKAQDLAQRGRYDEALNACKASLAIDPRNISAMEVLVQVLTYLNRYEDALETCADALEVEPNSLAIFASLKQLRPNVGRTEHAQKIVAIVERCLAASSARVDLFTVLAEMLLELRRYNELVQSCHAILRIDPEFFPAAELIRKVLTELNSRCTLEDFPVSQTLAVSDEYERLVASNAADALAHIMSNFYVALGIEPYSVPLVRSIDRFRQALTMNKPESTEVQPKSVLILFEKAWKQYRLGGEMTP